ncbi:MAG TPA: K(+)-transporting ATPase subunit F [Acidimicrobiales bacterium]|nr:K(+)-transporting ATPase subunit F [Acidimicrobiales bacterium]
MNLVALAMSGDDLVGLIIAILVTAYLVYALIRPEKL